MRACAESEFTLGVAARQREALPESVTLREKRGE